MSSNHVTMPGNLQADDGPDGAGHFQKDQLPPEVQCILGIFNDCISKAETAAILPPILLLNSQSRLEDPQLSGLLDEQQVLERKLEMFEWHAPEEGEGEEEDGHQAMIRLEEEIKNSFRDLLRLLRALPETVSAWKVEEGEELGLSERALIRELSVFQNHMVEKWLSRKHEEPQLAPAKEASSSDQDEEYMALMQFLAAEIKEVDSKVSAHSTLVQVPAHWPTICFFKNLLKWLQPSTPPANLHRAKKAIFFFLLECRILQR